MWKMFFECPLFTLWVDDFFGKNFPHLLSNQKQNFIQGGGGGKNITL